jgi:formylglycine-generating enzyme required for sulfatase activity
MRHPRGGSAGMVLVTSDKNQYDVFLSYNSLDFAHIDRVANELKARNCSVYLDRLYLTPGHDWVTALERALQASRSVAVFLGPREMGRWQQRERSWALNHQTGREDFPVIPVLLPGSEPPLGFLTQSMWIDLRTDPTSAAQLDALAAAIRGEKSYNGQPQPRLMICPYRGLRAFREEDSEFFFGRQKYTDELNELVGRNSIIAVTGASGSGKSSVVRAGLAPRLRHPASGDVWDILTMIPKDNPLHSLADVFLPLVEPELSGIDLIRKRKSLAEDLEHARVPLWDLAEEGLKQQKGTDRLMLVVDQWEELYTLCRSDTQRNRFIDELLDATARNGTPLNVVFTVRWDFYDRILKNRPLLDRLQNSRLDLGPMNREELRSAIEEPGSKVGLTFQDGLVNRILDDAGDEPGKLPLLEFVLEEIWKARRGDGQLTHAAYEQLGCLKGAIAMRAESVFGQLSSEEKSAAEFLFRRLVKAGAKTEEDTRRRAVWNGLNETDQRVARKLADERLLVTTRVETALNLPTASPGTNSQTVSSETVEVAHEELLRQWDRLKQWIDADRKFLQWRSRLVPLLSEYARDPNTALLRGHALRESRLYVPSRAAELETNECSFVMASQAADQRRRLLVRIMAAACVCGVLLVAYFNYQRSRNQQADELVKNLLIPSAESVEPFLKYLEPFRDLLTEKLVAELNNQDRNRLQRVHAAYGLVRFGRMDSGTVNILLDSIPWLPKDEGENLLRAIARIHGSKPMGETLAERARNMGVGERHRILAIQLGLGITDDAAIDCKLQADPTSRTSIILGFKEWPGDLKMIVKTLDATDIDPELRSALCMAVGGMGAEAKSATQETLKKLYVNAPDGGTHSAVDWALRQQGVDHYELRTLARNASSDPQVQRDWEIVPLNNDSTITMLKIPSHKFAMGPVDDEKSPSGEEPVEELLTFWMSDREVSIEQFYAILNDERQQVGNVNPQLPVTDLSWFNVIEYCNELSQKRKLAPYYILDVTSRDETGSIYNAKVTEAGGNGYRLPTEQEWEYACRAMSTTDYSFGEDVSLLVDFAVFSKRNAEICGTKRPNGWGLFDMYGNVSEWCYNSEQFNERVLRGSSILSFSPASLRSAHREGLTARIRSKYVGFRVCRTP